MLELPESFSMSRQLTDALSGRTIEKVVANQSPHRFAWFHGTPDAYPTLLTGLTFSGATTPFGGYIRMDAERATLLFGEGVNLRLLAPGAKRPPKHQLLLELDDGSALVASVQMYGGLWAYSGPNNNPYYQAALTKPSPLTDAFDEAYFERLFAETKPSLSVKAFLATEQRIPGFGNGVLQDILFLSGLHPASALSTVEDDEKETLYRNIKDILARMAAEGGRDTEKDLYGKDGGYRTLLSRKTMGFPCPRCGGPIERKAYLGGNVYDCPRCQVRRK